MMLARCTRCLLLPFILDLALKLLLVLSKLLCSGFLPYVLPNTLLHGRFNLLRVLDLGTEAEFAGDFLPVVGIVPQICLSHSFILKIRVAFVAETLVCFDGFGRIGGKLMESVGIGSTKYGPQKDWQDEAASSRSLPLVATDRRRNSFSISQNRRNVRLLSL